MRFVLCVDDFDEISYRDREWTEVRTPYDGGTAVTSYCGSPLCTCMI